MAKKVYCGKCRWYQSAGQGDEYQLEACMAITGWYDNYNATAIPKRNMGHPSKANGNNDCNRYRWNWFGWRGY